MSNYRKCQTCGKDMRHPRQPAAEHPNTTVMHNTTGCTSCVRRAKRAAESEALTQPCVECGTPTHPGKVSHARPEGVARRIGHGLCAGCYQANRREGLRKPEPVDLGLVPFIRNRRRRGIPTEGTRQKVDTP